MEISRFRETEVFVCLSVQISLFAMLVNIPSTVQFQLLDLNNVFMFIFMPSIIINWPYFTAGGKANNMSVKVCLRFVKFSLFILKFRLMMAVKN